MVGGQFGVNERWVWRRELWLSSQPSASLLSSPLCSDPTPHSPLTTRVALQCCTRHSSDDTRDETRTTTRREIRQVSGDTVERRHSTTRRDSSSDSDTPTRESPAVVDASSASLIHLLRSIDQSSSLPLRAHVAHPQLLSACCHSPSSLRAEQSRLSPLSTRLAPSHLVSGSTAAAPAASRSTALLTDRLSHVV